MWFNVNSEFSNCDPKRILGPRSIWKFYVRIFIENCWTSSQELQNGYELCKHPSWSSVYSKLWPLGTARRYPKYNIGINM